MRPAAFLDRDGTIIIDGGYASDPTLVTLIPGATDAIRRLHSAGYAVVVVTNQSGIGRGIFGWDEYRQVAAAMDRLLAEKGVAVDATYVCPHYPPDSGPCDCRKPGLANYRAAIEKFGIDPTRSLFVGDRLSDVQPATSLGGLGVLVETGEGGTHVEEARKAGYSIVADLSAAVDLALGGR